MLARLYSATKYEAMAEELWRLGGDASHA